MRRRLDAELARRGLARSREQAQQLIADGRVRVNGTPATKSATQVDQAAAIVVIDADQGQDYVSRGAHKLIGALVAFDPDGVLVNGRHALDAGASTGGFTDVLLHRGAQSVIAVDVGYGQLVWRLRSDERVVVLDRTNVRHLEPGDLPWVPDLIVADLSFISLVTVLPALSRVIDPAGDMLLMVKPQFEVGREHVGRAGVVRDPALHARAVRQVCDAAYSLGWGTAGVTASPVPGPSGNVEYFVWLHGSVGPVADDVISTAIAEGPLR